MGVEVQLHHSLTSALDGGEWSASIPCRFTPGERAPYTGQESRWAPEPIWTLQGENSCPCREWNSDCPARSPSLYRLSYPGSCMKQSSDRNCVKGLRKPTITLNRKSWLKQIASHLYSRGHQTESPTGHQLSRGLFVVFSRPSKQMPW
jgi:hypothetical protein